MEFRSARLRQGEWTAGIAGLVLLVLTFVTWYGVSVRLGPRAVALPAGTDAWDSYSLLDVPLALTIALALALAVTQGTQRSPAIPVTVGAVLTVLAPLTALLILIRILSPPGFDIPAGAPAAVAGFAAAHLDRSVEAGAWLGLLTTVAIAVGAWRSLRQEGLAPEDEERSIETVPLSGATTPQA